MSNHTKNLFELEKCLSLNDSANLIETFRAVINLGAEVREDFVNFPQLSIYIPKKAKNLKSKKTILILIHELSRTGAPVVAVDAAKTLLNAGYFVVVMTMRRGPLLKELLNLGIPVVFNRELSLAQESRELLGIQRSPLATDTFFYAFDQALVVTAVFYNLIHRYKNDDIPIIWWLHEGTATYNNLGKRMPQQLGPAIKVYVGGEYALDQLKKFGLPYHAKILNYGVSDKKIPSSNNTPATKVRFILPGSVGLRKGQTILLEAIKNLPSEYQSLSEFTFIGDIVSEADTPGKAVKNELIQAAKMFPNVKYITSVTREELFDIYQNTDVIVLPSLDDPMPVVATEMLMMGKIVLCSDTTGTSYYLQNGKNGFVFKSGNADELTERIIYIIDHKKRLAKIGENGRKVFEQNFDMPIFEKKLLEIVKEAT